LGVLYTTASDVPSSGIPTLSEASEVELTFVDADLASTEASPRSAELIEAMVVPVVASVPNIARVARTHVRDPEDLDFTPYRVSQLRGDRKVLEFDNPVADRAAVKRAIDAVLVVEAPVEATRLAKLVAAQFGLQRVVESRQLAVLSCVPRAQIKSSKLGRFVWAENQDRATWIAFRRSSDDCDRTYDEIAPEEVRNAMLFLTRKGMSMSDEGMLADLAEIFRVSRITAPFRERMSHVLKEVLKAKHLMREGDRIVLALAES
uniref:DUF3320 domain-containing protein n=1 Tax=Gemmatimonas sp. TaxID=1962908 RepID=UPI00356284EB